jgi:hypothetical protein
VTDVADYFHDATQGPRASISAFTGTLVRHDAAPAPHGGRFVQANDGPQIDLLADLCEPAIAMVVNGYLRSSDIADPPAFARALEDRFEAIRVGVHDAVEVVLGHDWEGAVEGAPHRTIARSSPRRWPQAGTASSMGAIRPRRAAPAPRATLAMSRVAGGKMRLTGVSCDSDCLPPSGVPSCAPPLFTELC